MVLAEKEDLWWQGVKKNSGDLAVLGYLPPNEFEELPIIKQNNNRPRQTLLTLSVHS